MSNSTASIKKARKKINRFYRPGAVVFTVLLAADLAAIALWPQAHRLLSLLAAAFTASLCLLLWQGLSLAESASDTAESLIEEERGMRACLESRNRQLENTIGKLEEVERIKKNFLLMASHQMRSPLVAIQSVIRVIVSGAIGGDDPSVKNLLQQAYDRSEDMLDMVNDILNLAEAKVERDEGAEQTDAAAEMNAVVAILTPVAAEKKVTIETEIAQNLPALRVVRKSVNHIFTNLVENAVKYSKESTKVKVKLTEEGDALRLEVADQGIGIPEKDQPRIFKEFFRADNAKSRIKQGTGLGLAIVHNLIVNLGGSITFRSKEDEGTTFTAKIPFAPKPLAEEPR